MSEVSKRLTRKSFKINKMDYGREAIFFDHAEDVVNELVYQERERCLKILKNLWEEEESKAKLHSIRMARTLCEERALGIAMAIDAIRDGMEP